MTRTWVITVCTECGARTEEHRDYYRPLPADDCETDRGCGRFHGASPTSTGTLVYCPGEREVRVAEVSA